MALRPANVGTALASTNAASGGLPPAICVVIFCWELSAVTSWNSMVMLGCSAWKFEASFFIAGWVPTQDENVTVVGEDGSGTGPLPFPAFALSVESPLPQPATTRTADASEPMTAIDLRDTRLFTGPAPSLTVVPRRGCRRGANRLA